MQLETENGTGAPVAIADADYASVYRWALGFAHKRAYGSDETEQVLIDAATDALMWARKNCKNADTFIPFAKTTIRRWFGRALHRLKLRRANRPSMIALEQDVSRRRLEVPAQPLLIEELPDDIAFVVRLYMVDGYNCREIGLLTGRSHSTVNAMLHKAAELLSPGRLKPSRGNGEKRLSAG